MLSRLTRLHGSLTTGVCAVILPFMLCTAAQAETLYFHRGDLGSVGLVSNAAGEIVARTRFQPYGEPTTVGSETDANAYARFTGKRQDSATGLYYFGARYYDAELGRFLSPDPAQQIPSPYAYAGSAPLVNVDPDGAKFSERMQSLFENLVAGTAAPMEATEHGGVVHRKVELHDLVYQTAREMDLHEDLFWSDTNKNWVHPSRFSHRGIYIRLTGSMKTHFDLSEAKWQTAVNRFRQANASYEKAKALIRRVDGMVRDIDKAGDATGSTKRKKKLLRRKEKLLRLRDNFEDFVGEFSTRASRAKREKDICQRVLMSCGDSLLILNTYETQPEWQEYWKNR